MNAYVMGLKGWVIAVLIAAIVGLILRKAHKKACPGEEYDERQIALRGKGFQYGFYTLVIEMLCYAFSIPEDWNFKIDPVVSIFALILISGLVMIGYDIMNDAYFTLKAKRKGLMISWLLLAALQLFTAIGRVTDGSFAKNGFISIGDGLPFVTFAFFLIFFLLLLIKAILDKKEERE